MLSQGEEGKELTEPEIVARVELDLKKFRFDTKSGKYEVAV